MTRPVKTSKQFEMIKLLEMTRPAQDDTNNWFRASLNKQSRA